MRQTQLCTINVHLQNARDKRAKSVQKISIRMLASTIVFTSAVPTLKCLWSRPLRCRFYSKSTSKVLHRKISVKNRPEIHISQAGYIGPSGLPSSEHTLIMVPGMMGTAWTDFRPQLEHLPDLLPPDWSVISFDPPGRAKSTPPYEVMPLDPVQIFSESATAIMDALCVKKYSILGWSGGGATSIQMAARRAERVERLVLLNTFTKFTPTMLAYFESIS